MTAAPVSRWRMVGILVVLIAFGSGPATSYFLSQRDITAVQAARRDARAGQAASDHARDVKDCKGRNEIRAGIVKYLTALAVASANDAQAVLDAKVPPTPETRSRAETTLRALPGFTRQAHQSFALEKCPT